MKTTVYFLMIFCFLAFTDSLMAQKSEPGTIVSIKGYKNAKNKKIAKKPIKAEVILELPSITLYRSFVGSSFTTSGGGSQLTTVDVSDTFWYCLRPGEDVATIISWTFNTQINKNVIFRKNAAEYFKDYPDLAKKIKSKEYKYDDIFEVVEKYNQWKSGE